MAAAWFGGLVGGVLGAVALIAVLVFVMMKRRARIEIKNEAEEVKLGKLAAPSILPNGGRHPAGTTLVIVPCLNASVYYRIGAPTEVHRVQFTRLDGQAITLGAPDASAVPGSDGNPWQVGTFVVQAFCYAPGREDSDIATAMLEIAPPEGDVFFSHPPGAYGQPFELTLWHPAGQTIFFTLDGSDPWECGVPYTPGGLWVKDTCEIRAAVQGSRVPSAVRRYCIQQQLLAPKVLVSGEVQAVDDPSAAPIIVTQKDRIGFSAPHGANILYSAEPFAAGYSKRYFETRNDTPSCVFSTPLPLTQGTWVVRAMAVKAEWADSAVITVRVICAPNAPSVQQPVRRTPPYKVRMKSANPVSYRLLRVPEDLPPGGTDEDACEVVDAGVDVPTPATVVVQDAGTYRLDCCAIDNTTNVRSEDIELDFEVEALPVEKPVAPLEPSIDPPHGQYVMAGESFPIIVNTKQAGVRVRLIVNGEAMTCSAGEEVHLRQFGVVKVTAAAVSVSDDTLVSAATSQVYRIAPPPPRLSPAGSGSYGVGFFGRVYKPTTPSWADLAVSYEVEQEVEGIEPRTHRDDACADGAKIGMGLPGRYHVVAKCTAGGFDSAVVEAFYEISQPPAPAHIPTPVPDGRQRQLSLTPAQPTPAPTFYPTDKHHTAEELEVFLHNVDGATTHYAVNDPDMARRCEAVPNVPFVVRKGDAGRDGNVVVYAVSAMPGHPDSPVVSKVYHFRSIPRPQPPRLTCHARQLMLELHVPDESVLAMYTLDGSVPLAEEGGSTHHLPSAHTVAIPDRGTTEIKAIAVDRDRRRLPSRVVSKVFVEGAPYLSLDKVRASAPDVPDAARGALAPPGLVAHPRSVAIVAAAHSASDVVRYTLDGSAPGRASPVLPPHGLQIALHMKDAPVTLRVVAYDSSNSVHSEEVVQSFVHVPGGGGAAERQAPARAPQPAGDGGGGLAAAPQPERTDVATSPVTPPAAAPPAAPPVRAPTRGSGIVAAGGPVDPFTRGYAAARMRALQKRHGDAQKRLG